ncbi:hypothetical protein EDC65_3292 [Stella humosa]|uniref:Uncharacterized protein n=1 Tax=Stella humosa TaxID=94 RepID=A0A3N1KZ75_9PROT|nr:hypothetical protein EDC65_3292 [Stella humosa]BBK33458.1 hypothetical protein STHU_40920 [Stella humosa]
MHRDQKDEICRQFAIAMALLERGHLVAMKGQSPKLTPGSYRQHALRLSKVGRELTALGDAIATLTSS